MNMMRRVSRLAVIISLLVWLAACSTMPRPIAAPAPVSPLISTTVVTPAPPSASAELPPLAPTVDGMPAGSDPAAELLAGEVPREFQRGGASWYGPRFHNRRTASGERYDQRALTAAHRSLPFGTMVRVRSLVNGREVDVRINDRGPYSRGRIIDVSHAAAEALGMMSLGFKDVVLLVPASTPDVVEVPAPVVKRQRPSKRSTSPRVR